MAAAADVAATIAQALSDLTPRFVWTFTAQQPALPEVPPKAPAEALPAPTAAPAAAPTAAAPGAVSINATAAPATAPLEQPRVTVDPLPLNQGVLGGRRRLRETNLLDLPRTEKVGGLGGWVGGVGRVAEQGELSECHGRDVKRGPQGDI